MSLQDGAERSAVAGHDPVTGRFQRGHTSEYQTRARLVKERLDALLATYKAVSAGDIALLSVAAVHLIDAEKARSRLHRQRSSNAAARILRSIPRAPAPEPTLAQMLGEG